MAENEKKTKSEVIGELSDQIKEGVAKFYNGDQWKSYLKLMSKFHNYSWNNLMLISMQCPDATFVAGFNKWKELGRYVNRGEKGIKIFAPSGKRKTKMEVAVTDANGNKVLDDNGQVRTVEKEYEYLTFHVVNVFDVSQTDGEPLPILTSHQLTGDVDEIYFQAIREVAPYPIVFENVAATQGKDCQGYCSYTEQKIAVQTGMSPAQTVSVALHEMAHAVIHSKANDKSREQREVEAESVSFMLANFLGVDSSETSFPYIAGWAQKMQPEQLEAVLRDIHQEATSLCKQLEASIDAIQKSKEQEKEKPLSFQDRLAQAKQEASLRNGEHTLKREKVPFPMAKEFS
jgi:hypothetical protein